MRNSCINVPVPSRLAEGENVDVTPVMNMFIILIPWLGVLSYLIVRGRGMVDRSAEDAAAMEETRRAYIRNVAGSSTADELTKLAALREKGTITDAEFEAQKAKLLG